MKLIPEQISDLRKRERELRESINGYRDYLTSRETISVGSQSIAQVGDSLTESHYHMERSNYNAVRDVLTNAEYVTERNTEEIQIGTKFSIQFDGDEEVETMILVDELFGVSSTRGFVSCVSPLGQSIVGKREGDKFSYELSGRVGSKITGTVKEIKKNPEDYLHFIKEKESKHRMSRPMRKKIHALLISPSDEAREEYEKLHEITISQKNLLMDEAARLMRRQLNQVEARRLAEIRKILLTRKVTKPNVNDGITVGSRVELFITDGVTTSTREFEYINRAVSNELEDEYVERISPLGTRLFGLKSNDSFEFQRNGSICTGLVLKVDNKVKGTEEKSSAPVFQKK